MRKTLFWIHLVCGVVVGLFVALLCLTGAALAFEEQLVAWAERDVRRISAPAPDTPRLTVAALRERLQQTRPDLKEVGLTLHRDPAQAVTFSAGREVFFANPWTGEIRQPATRRMAATMTFMTDLHRWLVLKGESRATGRAITGAVNLAFLGLCLTGLVLWWPRAWTRPALKMLAVPSLRHRGKVRDYNWHNAFGLWSLPVLVLLCLTAIPISYRWGGQLLYRLAGERLPEPTRPQGPRIDAVPGATPASPDLMLARAQADFPAWERLSLRSGSGRGRGDQAPKGPQPLSLMVKEADAWPRTATTLLTLHPFTGDVLKRVGHADGSAGTRLRHWNRFLHTGQALGLPGQIVAFLGCLAGVLLVWTGFALSWRRFFCRDRIAVPSGAPPQEETVPGAPQPETVLA